MKTFDHVSFVSRFMSRVSHSFIDTLFNELLDVQFFVKDVRGRYVQVNRTLKENYMIVDDQDIISKTDHELFPHYLADHYVQDDQQVFKGATICNRLELVGRYDGTAAWSRTTKTPLRSYHGNIIGLAGITRNLNETSTDIMPYQELSAVLQYIDINYETPTTVEILAEIANLSVRSLQRKFKDVYHLSPLQYARRVRVNKAAHLLTTTNEKITSIAASTGFSDQSHLTREFVNCYGTTPKAYRMRYCQHVEE